MFLGVVETGLFVKMAKHVIFGKTDGTIETKDAWHQTRYIDIDKHKIFILI